MQAAQLSPAHGAAPLLHPQPIRSCSLARCAIPGRGLRCSNLFRKLATGGEAPGCTRRLGAVQAAGGHSSSDEVQLPRVATLQRPAIAAPGYGHASSRQCRARVPNLGNCTARAVSGNGDNPYTTHMQAGQHAGSSQQQQAGPYAHIPKRQVGVALAGDPKRLQQSQSTRSRAVGVTGGAVGYRQQQQQQQAPAATAGRRWQGRGPRCGSCSLASRRARQLLGAAKLGRL